MERRNGNVIIRRGGPTPKILAQTAAGESFSCCAGKPSITAAEVRRQIAEFRSTGANQHSESGGTFRCH